jgi:hypothetical protein
MVDRVAGHWRRKGPKVRRFRAALRAVLETLATDDGAKARLQTVLEHEPGPGDLPPAVDPERVDPNRLLERLEGFWAAYRDLPAPEGFNSWTKYLTLPPPLPRLQRGMLDQCYRVLYRRRSSIDPELHRRLQSLILGDAGQPPGMEGWLRYRPLYEKDHPDLFRQRGSRS